MEASAPSAATSYCRWEGMPGRMMRMAKNENHKRYTSVEETMPKINAVTNQKVKDLAARVFGPATVSTTATGPALGKPL